MCKDIMQEWMDNNGQLFIYIEMQDAIRGTLHASYILERQPFLWQC